MSEKVNGSLLGNERRKLVLSVVDRAIESLIPEIREVLKTKIRLIAKSRSDREDSDLKGAAVWHKIESLSRLRGLLGGRFENLKRKWTEAGFPLKLGKGKVAASSKVKDEGWSELSAWILKQGYESRLPREEADYFFEIREICPKAE